LALHLQHYLGPKGSSRLPLVVSTDVAPQALALTIANAWSNDASIATLRMNHTNVASVAEMKNALFSDSHHGFAIVMGSSLQAIFHDTQNSDSVLWPVLDILLDKKNPEAIAAFVHTRTEPLQAPEDGSFQLLRRISGDSFGMTTRAGESSDFEVSVLRRRRQALSA
jgi:hypothetical protein